MAERLSQEDRLRMALTTLRLAHPLPPLNAAERSQFAARLIAEQWFKRNFNLTRFAWRPTWKGTALDVLRELAYYVVPRETWARIRGNGEAWTRRETCYTLLALVQHKMGADAAKTLREAMKAQGVKYRPRRMMTAVQRAALAERLRPKPKRPKAGAVTPGRRRIVFDED